MLNVYIRRRERVLIYACVILGPGHWHNGLSVRQWPETPGFNPRSSHTKEFFLNGTLSYLPGRI